MLQEPWQIDQASWRPSIVSENVLSGLSVADRPTLEGKLLQLPMTTLRGSVNGMHMSVLKKLQTLLPEANSRQANRLHDYPDWHYSSGTLGSGCVQHSWMHRLTQIQWITRHGVTVVLLSFHGAMMPA